MTTERMIIRLLLKIVILHVSYYHHRCCASFYATTNKVGHLARVEQSLIPVLYNYHTELQKHYDTLKRFTDQIYLSTIGESNSNVKNLYGRNVTTIDMDELVNDISQHPFKSLHLIHRFMNTWPKIQQLISDWNTNNDVFMNKVKELNQTLEFPGQAAIIESMTSLIKLKRTYNLPASNLIQGKLKEFRTRSGLNPIQCYELGRFALHYQIFTETIDLLSEGLKSVQRKSKLDQVNHGHKCFQGTTKTQVESDLQSLLDLAIERHDLKLKIGNFTASKNPFHFIRPLEKYPSRAFETREAVKLVADTSAGQGKRNMSGIFRAYENICDGKTFKTPAETKSLVCKLENRRGFIHPYFHIRPLKIEYHHQNPLLLQIHDVLSAVEIGRLVQKAQPHLSRSLVVGENATKMVHYGRTSSNTFINDYEPGNPFHYISRRIELMIGLRASILAASEDLQIANYGPGMGRAGRSPTSEYYGPHFDAGDFDEDLEKLVPFQKFRGDRLATFMIYLNKVQRGGSTAFPRLGISVKPVKGSGVFWFNLRHDGSQEPLSLHAGCPVLYGTKWIANKWIRVNENMFTRKCPIVQPPKTI